ncbi:MAG: DUF445 domain-containing protein [Flavobacteriaceae bacterium]|nr:DUF445 domain-containing protein [Flavobacteriaceae bacterium]
MSLPCKVQGDIFRFVSSTLLEFGKTADTDKLSKIVSQGLKKELANIDMDNPLGSWLLNMVSTNQHSGVWAMVLGTLQKTINTPQTREVVEASVGKQTESIIQEGGIRSIFMGAAQVFGGMDNEEVANKLLVSVNSLVEEVKADENHPLRKKMDNEILVFAQKLMDGDADSHALVDSMKQKLADNIEFESIVENMLNRAKNELTNQLEDKNSSLFVYMKSQLSGLLANIDNDMLNKVYIFLKDKIVDLVENNHHLVAKMVEDNLEKLDDRALVAQIEDKVGDDLQYIRLNGAIVGGFVGVFIALVKLILF